MSTRAKTIWTFVVTSSRGVHGVARQPRRDHRAARDQGRPGRLAAGLEWTVNAYTLTFAVLLLTGAALGDRFGRKRMFGIGLALFTRGLGAGGAVAPTIGTLIARPRPAGRRRRHRDAADADDPLGRGAAGPPRPRPRRLERHRRPRRRPRPGRRRRRRRRPLLAVDLLAQRAHRHRAAAHRLLPAQREQGPQQRPRPARVSPWSARACSASSGVSRTATSTAGRASASPGPIVGGLALVAAFVLWELRSRTPMVPMRFFRSAPSRPPT